MIPNKFGIIRNKYLDLFGCMFENYLNLSEYEFEIVEPEWIDDYYFQNGTGPIVSNGLSYSITDASKYEYVLIPGSINKALQSASGFLVSESAVSLSNNYMIFRSSVENRLNTYYTFQQVSHGTPYILANVVTEMKAPIIGFIRHRSDNVNPKGISKDVNSNLLQPVKADELNGEAFGSGDELSSSIEKSDLDSIAQPGTESEANG